jgi:hypothetical protein
LGSIRNLAARALRKVARTIDPVQPIIYLDDEFVTQLCYINAGIMEKGNLHSFDYVIGHLPSPAPILEIGSYCGLSANLLTYLKHKHGVLNQLITCDKWEFQKPEGATDVVGRSPIRYKELEGFARESYIRNIKMFSAYDLPFTFEMTSDEFFRCWSAQETKTDVLGRQLTLGGPLSFCFIDGNHTHEYARRDFLNCDAHLQDDGFILFDDSTLEKDGVRLVIPEVLASGRYKLVARNPYHLFQKVATRSGAP